MGSLFTRIYNSRISGALNKVYNYRHKDNLDADDADEEVEKKVVDEDDDDCVAFDGDGDDISVHIHVVVFTKPILRIMMRITRYMSGVMRVVLADKKINS